MTRHRNLKEPGEHVSDRRATKELCRASRDAGVRDVEVNLAAFIRARLSACV